MAFLFPRVAFAPATCAAPAARNEFAPLFSLFDEALNEIQRGSSRHHRRSFAPRFNPRFDVKEVKEAYQLEGELPGVEQKDIQIEFTDEHTLVIKGRQEQHREAGTPPAATMEAATEKAAVEEAAATPAPSETASVKSHQPTVEDEEAPANASAVAATTEAATSPAPETETPKPEQPSSKYWISERGVGEFSRSFSFPARVDQDAVKASLKNGILSILVPKAKIPESRRIQVE